MKGYKMDLPCRDCLVLAICIRFKHIHVFSSLNLLANRCSLLYGYLTLADIGFKFPGTDAPQDLKNRFKSIQHPRIIELTNYMKWDYEL